MILFWKRLKLGFERRCRPSEGYRRELATAPFVSGICNVLWRDARVGGG